MRCLPRINFKDITFEIIMKHIPVMTLEVIKFLAPPKNKNYVDCTVGLGGHAREILKKIKPNGKLLCIDQNQGSLDEAEKRLKKYHSQCVFVLDNFRNLHQILRNTNFPSVSGIIYDLGLASWQIEKAKKGISFQKDEPLDMRLQSQNANLKTQSNNLKLKTLTAEEIVNRYPVKKIADILYQYGDVRNSWGVARKIEIARRIKSIKTTFDLREALKTKNPKILAPIFQALRIAVNNELENLQNSLEQAIRILEPGGRIVVISYHSGEDRIVKNMFRHNKNILNILTKKPVTAESAEISKNSRARSAKLRAGKIAY